MQSIIFLSITLQLRVQHTVSAHNIMGQVFFFSQTQTPTQCSGNFNITLVTNMGRAVA